MTFEQFQATRRHVDDLKVALPHFFEHLDTGCPGHVYAGGLSIEDVTTEPRRSEDGRHALAIGNVIKISNDLPALERTLYEFGKSEGLLD